MDKKAAEAGGMGPMSKRIAVARIVSNWMNPQYLKLHAGEMSMQEVRTVRAVLKVVGWQIDQEMIDSENAFADLKQT